MWCRVSLGGKVDKNEIQRKILEEEDYVRCPKCSNSLVKCVARNPEGVDNSAIARFLMIPEEKVNEIYKEAIEMLKKGMANESSND